MLSKQKASMQNDVKQDTSPSKQPDILEHVRWVT